MTSREELKEQVKYMTPGDVDLAWHWLVIMDKDYVLFIRWLDELIGEYIAKYG